MASQYDFTVTLNDLAFILQQIKISEAATNPDGTVNGDELRELVSSPLLPYGIRTVDGSWNNLLPGQELYGSADQTMPRLTAINWQDPSYAQLGSNVMVVDADPRIISNLISDQTASNPAAVEAHEGLVDVPGGGTTSENGSLSIPNLSPDVGLSPAFNGWMTFFGQFFDHGLDLIPKAGNGIVFIPLEPDDPLYIVPTAENPNPPNFMVLTRSKVDANHDTINLTTPWIDQNQTYTSHPSHQIFLREYVIIDGKPEPTGNLLGGQDGGLATWADVKLQAETILGIKLTDQDVFNVPLLATDRYGNLILNANGKVQIVTTTGLQEANGDLPTGTLRTGHAFLDDIGHTSAPKAGLEADSDNVAGGDQAPGTYDDEMLDRHFITGDGRGNENIGLTAVHAVFHSEHNRLVEQYKTTLLATGDINLINQWLMPSHQLTILPADTSTLVWNGEYLFQAGRFTTEMEYQHLVFEEFARTVQPAVDPFVFSNTADINPAIFAEFAHVVYRFGHSMLTETVARIDSDMDNADVGLIEAFLNPVAFNEINGVTVTDDQAIGAIVRGMTRQVGNEIDEFITDALRNNLIGLPLDLGALNIARARETGMPTLNQAREQFFELSGNSELRPYTSWADFTTYLKNPASIINFMAAYGQHQSILDATTLEGKRDAVNFLLFGNGPANPPPADAMDFFNSTGEWATKESGLNMVDFWIGGLAERKNEFGGMLGSTFNFVFETQMEMLQDGDRFYYLSRVQGLNILNELEANSFSALVMRNSDLGDSGSSHLPANLFLTPDHIFEVDQSLQIGVDPQWENALKQLLSPLFVRRAATGDADGDGNSDGAYLKYTGDGHVVLGGSAGNDTLIGGKGIDSLWGDGGNDRLDGGDEADVVHGGDGNDIITDTGTPVGDADFLHGDEGHDVISSGNGNDLIFGGGGSDFIIMGEDAQEAFAGRDNDFVLGGSGSDALLGNEGDDWLEGGEGFDSLTGENSQLFFNSTIIGHDVLNGQGNDTDYDGEAGDDIMVQGAGIQRNNGMEGFDWAIHKGDTHGANSDLGIPIFVNQQDFILRDRFDLVEGLSGWKFDDVLVGTDRPIGTAPVLGTPLTNNLTQEGADRITGLQDILGVAHSSNSEAVLFNPDDGSDILLGGGGKDRITGKEGNDIIDGDAWLNVRIAVARAPGASGVTSADSMNELKSEMLAGTLKPNQLSIVREILKENNAGDIDTAVYRDISTNYTFTRMLDGSLRVDHATPDAALNLNDGIDRLLNIETLEFGNGQQLLVNSQQATGNLTISDTTPQVGDLLQVNLANLQDANGIAANTAITLTWQAFVGGNWQDQATGPEFRVPATIQGAALRVQASFNDQMGDAETLTSGQTQAVVPRNQATTGVPVINDLTPTESVTLTAVVSGIADADGLSGGNFSYQWRMSSPNGFTNIVGATAATYTPPQALLGRTLLVVVTVIDDEGNPAVILTSAATQPIGDFIVGTNAGNFLTGTAWSDIIRGELGNDTLAGGAGDDLLVGGDGNDNLSGDAGQDTLQGDAGNDSLNGGVGADSLAGGTGNDTYIVDNAGDVVIEGLNAGTDVVQTTLASYVLTDNVEQLVYTGAGNFTGTGNAIANTITGGNGNDTLSGLGGNDLLIGGLGNDTLDGGDGVDDLQGGTGNDVIVGGTGDDVLTGGIGTDRLSGQAGNDNMNGGTGSDTFVFSASVGLDRDRIADFDSNVAGGQDFIDLSLLGINANNFASSVAITANNGNTVVTIGDDNITLVGINATTVNINDFNLIA